MSSLSPCSRPAWQAPVCEDQSVSQRVRRWDPSRSQRAIVGALPSRSARTSTSWASPSISSSSSPGLSRSLPGAVRRALRSTTLRYQKPSSSIASALVAAVSTRLTQSVITTAPAKVDTCSPRLSSESSHTTAPFTSNTPNPSVSTVKGSATRSSTGHTSAFSSPITAISHTAAPKLFSVTPGISSPTTQTVIAERIHTSRIRPSAIRCPRRGRPSRPAPGARRGARRPGHVSLVGVHAPTPCAPPTGTRRQRQALAGVEQADFRARGQPSRELGEQLRRGPGRGRRAQRPWRPQGAPVDRDHDPRADHGGGPRGPRRVEVARSQRPAPAGDRQQREVDAAGQLLHLLEQVGVAGEVHGLGAGHEEADRRRPSCAPPATRGMAGAGGTHVQPSEVGLLAGRQLAHVGEPPSRQPPPRPAGASTVTPDPRARSEPAWAWSACRWESSTASRCPMLDGVTAPPARRRNPTREPSTGSVIRRTPSSSIRTVAWPEPCHGRVHAGGGRRRGLASQVHVAPRSRRP